jgi:hypothetical protein
MTEIQKDHPVTRKVIFKVPVRVVL